MRNGSIVIICLIGLSVLAFALRPATAAERAVTPAEADAMTLRGMQTDFMVAALQCRRAPEGSLVPLYNAFVTRFGDELIANARTLRTYFRRSFGNAHQARFDGWLTGLANAAALRGTQPGFCADARAGIRAALVLDGAALRRLAVRRDAAEIAELR